MNLFFMVSLLFSKAMAWGSGGVGSSPHFDTVWRFWTSYTWFLGSQSLPAQKIPPKSLQVLTSVSILD